MKPCTKFEERISEMLFGEIPENESQKLHIHMAGCDGCMEFYLSLYETLEAGENEEFSLTEDQKNEIFEEAEKLDKPIKKFSPLWTTGVSIAASLVVSGIVIMSSSGSLGGPALSSYKTYEATDDAIEIEVAKDGINELEFPSAPSQRPSKDSVYEYKNVPAKNKSESLKRETTIHSKFIEEKEEEKRQDLSEPKTITFNIKAFEANDSALEDTNDEAPSTDDSSLNKESLSDIVISPSEFSSPSVYGGRGINGRQRQVEKKANASREEESLDLVVEEQKAEIDGLGTVREKSDYDANDLVGGIGDVAGGELKTNNIQDGQDNGLDDDPFAEADPFGEPAIDGKSEMSFGYSSDLEKQDDLDELSLELKLSNELGQKDKKKEIVISGKGDSKQQEGVIRQNLELEADSLFNDAEVLKQSGDLENAKIKVEQAVGRLAKVPQSKRILNKKEMYQEFYGNLIEKEAAKRPMLSTQAQPMSTFSIDVDTASYQMAKQLIQNGQRPDPLSIRAEEFINSFNYKYEAPKNKAFKVHSEVVDSPFHRGSKIMKIGVQGKQPGGEHRLASHFCFIVDTSGSMADESRLPMVKKVLPMIIKQMTPGDKVSLVSCGLKSRLELDFADVQNKSLIAERIQSLNAVGATNLEASLLDGYRQVQKYIRKGIYSRVVLFSDGVANLGEKNANHILQNLQYAKDQGAGITVIGMGDKEYNDNFLETLADKGDGNYVFIGNNKEALKTFEEKFAATFHTIAYNVKIQVEFDPNQVSKYRLLGYENRRLKNKDFRNDKVDAGEVGSGQSVTAIYEVEMSGNPSAKPMAEIRLRYRDAVDRQMHEFATPVLQKSYNVGFEKASEATRLSLISGKFAEVLRDGGSSEGITANDLLKYIRPLASQMGDSDVNELLNLIEKSK